MLSCPSLNLCFIHPDSSSHTFLLFTHETPNSITVRVPWEADSGAAERHSRTQHVGQLHHGSDFTAGRATALTKRTAFSTFLCFNYPSSIAENNTRKGRAAHVLHKFLTDKKISAGEQQRYSHSTRSG